jgi:DNA-binding HxlR family transcriptional regulator
VLRWRDAGQTYDNQRCSIARTLVVVGERWSLLLIRDALLGLHRFEEYQDSLGVARNVLARRLTKLGEHALLGRVCYQERPARYEYRPTGKAKELLTALLSLMHWGDEHAENPLGLPRITTHTGCGAMSGSSSPAPNAARWWDRTPFRCSPAPR